VTLDITLTDSKEAIDTVLTVYDGDGNKLDENDDRSGTSRNSEIKDLKLKAGQKITIEASTYDPTVTGDYTLSVQATS